MHACTLGVMGRCYRLMPQATGTLLTATATATATTTATATVSRAATGAGARGQALLCAAAEVLGVWVLF